ncbi:hypothetical protein IWQ62_005170, partial [Dispira parvispora]
MATFAYPEQTQGLSGSPVPNNGSNGAPTHPGNENSLKATLWMGDVEPWMDQAYLRQVWYNLGEQVNVKVIYNRATGAQANYCFVEFPDMNSCNKAFATYNGTFIPGTQKQFRLNWATGGMGRMGHPGNGGANGGIQAGQLKPNDFPIFVGDLAPEVNDYLLLNTIQARFPSCFNANVKVDTRTGASRGYGFARFSDESEYHRALAELGGLQIGSRAIRVGTVVSSGRRGPHPGNGGYYQQQQQAMMYGGAPFHGSGGMHMGALDPTNTTVFVGGLTHPVTENELRQHFQNFGVITHVKIPHGKGCAFVQFQQRNQAEMAIAQLNGTQIGSSNIRLSWGRGNNPHVNVNGGGNNPNGANGLPHPHMHPHAPQPFPPQQAYGRMNGNGYYPQQIPYPNGGGAFRQQGRDP